MFLSVDPAGRKIDPSGHQPLGIRGRMFTSLAQVMREMNTQKKKGGNCSGKTRRNRRLIIDKAFRILYDEGFYVTNPACLKPKHLKCILRYWEAAGLEGSTMQTYISAIRVFLAWFNKENLLANPEIYLENPERLIRGYRASEDRSIECYGDPLLLIDRVHKEDDRVAAQLLLSFAFGMRPRESWAFRPHQQPDEGVCHILWGTKGGRPRRLLVDTDFKRDSFLYAKTFAETVRASMMPSSLSQKQWRNRYYYILGKHGLTREKLGATAYSYRVSYLNWVYETVSGYPSPVRASLETIVRNKLIDKVARLEVSEQAGHSRIQIAGAYIG